MTNIPYFRACLLGGFSLIVDGKAQVSINQPQQQSMLAYLMLRTETPQLRKHVAFLFWPEVSEKRAYANLRGALHKLRSDCPVIEHYLVSTNTTLSWQRSPLFSLDVWEFETLVTQTHKTATDTHTGERLMHAAACYRGELLPGCYDEWLLPERERLNQHYIQLLHHLVDLLVEQNDYEKAIQYATQLRHTDPFREQTYQRLMTLYEKRGDRATALRVYHDCVVILERELGVEPSPETQVHYRRILNRTTPLTTAPSTAAAISPTPGHKLIGRQTEWQTLQNAWHKASQGHPHLVLLKGEAGIGKTHLAEALLSWANQHGHLTVHTRSYSAEGQLTYTPVIDWLRSPPYLSLLSHLEDVWLVECARLLPEILSARPDLSPPPPLSDSWQRQRLFEALARAALSPQKPILVLLDDLQWGDKESLEWLHFLLRFDNAAPLMLLGTVRMSEVMSDHPLTTLQQQLYRDDRIQEISLTPLTATASDELAKQTAGSELATATLAELRHYAEGVPLFLIEAIRAEINKAESERWRWPTNAPALPRNTLPLPPKVYAVIRARLAQLSPGARQLANAAAVIGRSFSLELLALASHSNEETLVQNLDELWQRDIIREQGTHYDLSHDRIRDVAYAELPPMQRKQLHRHVAAALTQRHTDNLDAISLQLAHHFEAAGLLSQAIDAYLQAGEMAQRVYAHEQAADLLHHALTLSQQLPATRQRDRQTLSLYSKLATSLWVLGGWGSSELYEIANRAWQLSLKLNDATQRFHWVRFLFGYYGVQGNWGQGSQLARQALVIAEQEQSDPLFLSAYNLQATVDFCRGEFKLAQTHFMKSLSYYDIQHDNPHDPHVLPEGIDYILSFAFQTHSLWLLGFPDKALKVCQESVAVAQKLNHPFSQGLALVYLMMLYQFRGETDQVAHCAETCLELVTRYKYGYYRHLANIFFAWTQALNASNPMGFMNLQKALDEFRAMGMGLRWSYYLSLLAIFYEKTGQVEEGLATINRALAAAAQYNENWWNAELYRLRGNLLLLRGDSDLAGEAYQQAIHLARQQQALALELRATTSLARLWQAQGQGKQAYVLLSAVYQQFSEGFNTPDLQEAQALLANLSH